MQKDNLSVLTNTIDYIRQLKEQITGLEMAGSTSTAAASTDDPAVLQAPAVTSGARPSSSTAAVELAQQLRSEAAAAATTHPSSSSINNTTTVAVSWRQFELAGTEAAAAHGGMRAGTNTGISSNVAGQLVIEVETPYNNPQSLIQVLSVVQDLGLDLDSLSSGNLNNGRMKISVRVLVSIQLY